MLKSLCCDTPSRRARLGWLSFQPKDGAISFGLSDNTYVSPDFRVGIGIWNAYNRVRTRFEIISTPNAAVKILNPHLTWHPPHWFHFKSHIQSAAGNPPFWGLADIPLMLQQQGEVKWIRAISGPLSRLKSAGPLRGRFQSQELVVKALSELVSINIAIDFISLQAAISAQGHETLWYIPWQNVGIRLGMSFTYPHIATISWAHYH